MFCPNCGTKTSIDQNFCRACGLGLEKIAVSLTEQLPTKPNLSLQQQKERFEKLGLAALSVFGLGILGLVIYLVANSLMTSDASILVKLGVVGFVIMMACGLASVILFAKAKEVGEEAAKRKPQDLASTESTKELLTEGHFEPVPTVTDRTTELLTVEKRDANSR